MEDKRITIQITVDCANDAEHLAVSSYLKTILEVLDSSVEGRHQGNDFISRTTGMHIAAETKFPGAHPLSKML